MTEDNLEELAEEYKNKIKKLGLTYKEYTLECVGFKKGYNKAKEKYKWSDEDVIQILEKSRETGLTAEYLLLTLKTKL